jgi:hypothetical protein
VIWTCCCPRPPPPGLAAQHVLAEAEVLLLRAALGDVANTKFVMVSDSSILLYPPQVSTAAAAGGGGAACGRYLWPTCDLGALVISKSLLLLCCCCCCCCCCCLPGDLVSATVGASEPAGRVCQPAQGQAALQVGTPHAGMCTLNTQMQLRQFCIWAHHTTQPLSLQVGTPHAWRFNVQCTLTHADAAQPELRQLYITKPPSR